MADGFERIEKRLDSIEERLSKIEGRSNTSVPFQDLKSTEDNSSKSSSSPVGAILLLVIGGYVLLSNIPRLISMLFYPYDRYGYGGSYFDYSTLIFLIIGAAIFSLGIRSFIKYRTSKNKPSVHTSGKSEFVETTRPLEVKSGVSKPEKSEDSIEYQIASHWFSIVGVIAILLGVALFLKFAFDNNWIGPVGQVSIGIVFGIFLLGVGDYFRTKYAVYGQIVSGCGIGVLYLSLWAAHAVFGLIDQYAVLGAMSLVTAATALLSIRYNSIYIAALGILGGFVTPLLLAKGFDQMLLLTYITLLNFGVLGIAFFKNWRELNLLTFAATYIDFAIWYSNYASRSQNFLEAFVFLTIFFVIFSLIWVVYHLVYQKEVKEGDVLLSLMNALVYFGFSLGILNHSYKDFLGFFAFGMALYYVLFGYMAYAKFKADSALTLGFLGSAILFLTVAVPLQVDKNLITIIWGLEAAVLVWVSFWVGSYKLRIASMIIFILVAIRLIAFDAIIPPDQFTLIFNRRFISYIISAICVGIAAYSYVKYRQGLQDEERPVLPALLIAINVVLVAALTLESMSYFDKKIYEINKPLKTSYQQHNFSLIGDVEAQANTYVYWVHEKSQFESGCCIEVNPSSATVSGSYKFTLLDRTAYAKAYDGVVCSPNCDAQVVWTGPVYFSLDQTGAYTLTLTPSGQTFPGDKIASPSPYNPNTYTPPDTTYYPQNNVTYPQQQPVDKTKLDQIRKLEATKGISVSIIWLAYSLLLLVVGVSMKYKPIRLAALVFFAVTILKVFLVDSSSLQQLYRIIAFIVLGTILLVVAYIYQRFKQQINAFLLNG